MEYNEEEDIAKPIDRDQVMITTFDSLVEWNSIARVIDHFVNNIDLAGMGFKNAARIMRGVRDILRNAW